MCLSLTLSLHNFPLCSVVCSWYNEKDEFVYGCIVHLSSKESKVPKLIRGMDIEKVMTHVKQVEEDKLRDKNVFC